MPGALARKERAPRAHPAPPLTPLETEVIDLFVHLARILGVPKTVAEIFGLLFVSPKPLAMEELIARLSLSKGSASQGLRFLRSVGAVKTVYVAGTRRDHYLPETELRKLLRGFLREKLEPYFQGGAERLQRIERALRQMPNGEQQLFKARVAKIRNWERQGKRFIPLISKLLGP